jgi:protein-disulfide isomerase
MRPITLGALSGPAQSVVTAVLILGLLSVTSAQEGRESHSAPAASVSGEIISLEEVERAVAGQLVQLEQQRYQLLSQQLERAVNEHLLAQEAQRRRLSVEQLLAAEVYAKTPEVTDVEVASFIDQNRARLPRGDEADLRRMMRDHLLSLKIKRQLQEYVGRLKSQTQIAVYLKEPAAVRVQVSPEKGVIRGDKDAPVTVVEFADFQCPFCKFVLPTLKQVMNHYEAQVRWVFRDFPVPSLHPGSPKVHEAARCAGDQGKFWEYHDLLFERSQQHALPELEQYARDLNLDREMFGACLSSAKYQAEISGDVENAKQLGVSATPTFFINGRMLVGVQPLAAFQSLIDDELKKQAAK